jgi:16S rRNA (uracil1498-N3)-methyltransferase
LDVQADCARRSFAVEEDRARSRRFFQEVLPTHAGEVVPLSSPEAHHAVGVLRLRAGAAVELFDGRGGTARGTIAAAQRNTVTVLVSELPPPQARRGPVVHLAFGEPKGKRLDWLLEKATELGAASLTPVRFQRSVAGQEAMTEPRRERWLAHCIAAAKQSGLNFLPRIEGPMGLGEFLKRHHQRLCILGDAGAPAKTLQEAVALRRDGQELCLLVGPEGGLTEEEQAEALVAGFIAARLGSTTLRTETAAIALLAAVAANCQPRRAMDNGQ